MSPDYQSAQMKPPMKRKCQIHDVIECSKCFFDIGLSWPKKHKGEPWVKKYPVYKSAREAEHSHEFQSRCGGLMMGEVGPQGIVFSAGDYWYDPANAIKYNRRRPDAKPTKIHHGEWALCYMLRHAEIREHAHKKLPLFKKDK